MDERKAIEVIKSNWPPNNYTLLQEALTMAINSLEEQSRQKEMVESFREKGGSDVE